MLVEKLRAIVGMQFHNGDLREILMIYKRIPLGSAQPGASMEGSGVPEAGEHTEEDYGQESRTGYA